MDDQLGFWADPIYRTGDYPPSVLARIPDWALPRMTDEQKKLNLGTADFFGLNHYTTSLVKDCDNNGVHLTSFFHKILIKEQLR